MTLLNKKFFLSSIFFLFSLNFIFASDDNVSVINIESAQKTEYKKSKENGDDEIILSGAVVISVSKGGTKTTITADKVIYNRKTDMLYASGGVTLTQSGSSAGGQDVSADSLLFNTSTLEGVFDNGRAVQTQSDAINLPSGSKLVVSSQIFGRDSSSTIAFKNGVLTFCDDENPHWNVKASRIWLLPGGEFAFFNAVLYVGRVPLLYLPAFYYPKDELLFNPVFGYAKRPGYFMQTTTYLLGRKPLDTSSSSSSSDDVTQGLFNFMKSTKLKEQVREGLVLHNLDTDYTGNTSDYLKLIADYYTNLGAVVGLEGTYKPKKIFSSIEGNVKLAFSNTVFYTSEGYTPYSSSGTVYYDTSNFMALPLPFRYSANFKTSMTKPFNLSVSLPIYSDPYFTYDFGERSESMDWVGFLMSSASDDEDEDTSGSEVSSFTWNINGSYSFPLPQIVKPFISNLSLSSFGSSLVFSSKSKTFTTQEIAEDTDYWRSYTPQRKFFYPSQVTPFKIAGKISGTLIQIPASSTSSSSTKTLASTLILPEEFMSDEEKKAQEEKKEKLSQTENSKEENIEEEKREDVLAEEEKILPDSALPELTVSSKSVTAFTGLNYSLTYSIAPEYTSQLTYDGSKFTSPEEFEWSKIQSSYYQLKSPVTLSSALSYRSSFFSMNNSFSFNPVFQKHPSLEGYSESSAASIVKSDYNARKLDLSNTNSISFKPFIHTQYFKNTGLSWNTTTKLIQTNFIGDEENPQWEYITADLTDEDCVTSHSLSATLSAVEGDFSQILTLSTTLPPQVDKYTANLKFTFPYFSTTIAGGVQQKSSTDETWVKNPFQQSSSLSFKLLGSSLSFTESFNYNIEDNYADSLKFSLSWKNFQAAYTMQYTNGYDFDTDQGWVLRTDTEGNSYKQFLPFSASLAYSTGTKTFRIWKNRITWAPSLSTSIVWDCIRGTNSYFRFVPALTFKINEFLDLSFSSESRNNVIFRYVQHLIPSFEGEIPGETNPFVDLLNSFVFWDDAEQTTRHRSGFKLKSLKMTVSHKLCDWSLDGSITVKPRLITLNNKRQYDFSPYVTISVVWNPLPSMKTEVVDDYGTWELNP